MDILQELLEDDSSERFLRENWQRVPYSRPHAAKKLMPYFSTEHFSEVAKAAKSTIKIVKENKIIQAEASFPPAMLTHQLEQGYSVVIRHAEKSVAQLGALTAQFQVRFNAPVDIQVFVTPPSQQTFGWHYDAEDVFIVQTEGTKKYTLRQNTVNPKPKIDQLPEDMQYEKETSKVVLSCELQAGDWLYIPTGWWHCAQAITRSIHLSIGIDVPKSRISD